MSRSKKARKNSSPKQKISFNWIIVLSFAVLLVGLVAIWPKEETPTEESKKKSVGSEKEQKDTKHFKKIYNLDTDYELARKQRIDIWEEYLECAWAIVDTTEDEEAAEVLNFLEDNVIVAYPKEDGFTAFKKGKIPQTSIFALPILKDESEKSIWNEALKNRAGKFNPEYQMLIFRAGSQGSRINKGLLILHEGFHAYTFSKFVEQQVLSGMRDYSLIKKKADLWAKTREKYSLEEVQARNLEYRLLRKMFPQKYEAYILKQALYLKQLLDNNGQHITTSFPPLKITEHFELQRIYGEAAASRIDEVYRDGTTWVNGCFRLIDMEISDPSMRMERKKDLVFEMKKLSAR